MILHRCFLLAALFAVTTSLAGPFQNGSFEAGLNPPTNSYRSLSTGATDIDGWVVVAGRVDWSGEGYVPRGRLDVRAVGR